MPGVSAKDRQLAAIAGLLLFGAGGVLALVRAPVSGAIGVGLGLALGGAVVTAIVRARRAGNSPSGLARGAFLTFFLVSLPTVILVPVLGLGYLCGLLCAASCGLLIRMRVD
jgi:hypothetical protein